MGMGIRRFLLATSLIFVSTLSYAQGGAGRVGAGGIGVPPPRAQMEGSTHSRAFTKLIFDDGALVYSGSHVHVTTSATSPALVQNYVPYVGAIKTVNLNPQHIIAESAEIDGDAIVYGDSYLRKNTYIYEPSGTGRYLRFNTDITNSNITTNAGNILISAGGPADLLLRVGDAIGGNKVSIQNSLNAEVAYINSLGNALFNGSVNCGPLYSDHQHPTYAPAGDYVPYIGAIKDVDLGSQHITADTMEVDGGDFYVRGGGVAYIYDPTNADYLAWAHDGTAGRVTCNSGDMEFDADKDIRLGVEDSNKTYFGAGKDAYLEFDGKTFNANAGANHVEVTAGKVYVTSQHILAATATAELKRLRFQQNAVGANYTYILGNVDELTGAATADGFRMRWENDFFGTNNDAYIWEKTDGNDADPDGGMAIVNTGNDGIVEPAMTIRGDGTAIFHKGLTIPSNFYSTHQHTGYVPYVGATAALDMGTQHITLSANGNLLFQDTRGYQNNIQDMATHWSDLTTNVLLDRSRSTLSCVGGVLTYTLIAIDGTGTWNFGGKFYPASVVSASINLVAGTDAVPVTNFVYWELVADVPTMKVSTTQPTGDTIDVATFIVGAVSGTDYTIYGYDRNREETDKFVSRVITRIENSGTLYKEGLAPTVTSGHCIVTASPAAQGKWFSGIFEFFTENTTSSTSGFWYINGAGQFVKAFSPSALNTYSDGTAVAAADRVNIVWGIVPCTTTTSGTVATTVKLFATLQSKPTVAYNTDALARQDLYEATNYFPPHTALKNMWVPIARTIARPSTNAFITFDTGIYYKDVRGKLTSGGGGGTMDVSGLVPYTGATTSVNLGAYDLTATNLYGKISNTHAEATAAAAGFVEALSGIATQYYDGSGSWSTPAGGTTGNYVPYSVYGIHTHPNYSSDDKVTWAAYSTGYGTHVHPNYAAVGVVETNKIANAHAVATTSATGFAPILSNIATQYLDGTGNYSTPASGSAATTVDEFTIQTHSGSLRAAPRIELNELYAHLRESEHAVSAHVMVVNGIVDAFNTADTIDASASSSYNYDPTGYQYLPSGASILATGGNITTDGDYKVHTFTGDGTFTVTGSGTVAVLVVGGGGGGGVGSNATGYAGGGGGGGGVQYNASYPVSTGGYSVVIGAVGVGSGAVGTKGTNGGSSVFNSAITAAGGGGGGSGSNQAGANGACGGGGSLSGGGGTGSEGGNGGTGNPNNAGGGGGGMQPDNGDNGTTLPDNGGNGGEGYASSITGASLYYGSGGGGAGASAGGAGANSVGGTGATATTVQATAGATNRGGGGGGGAKETVTDGKNGGTGVIIVRYYSPSQPSDMILTSKSTTAKTANPTKALLMIQESDIANKFSPTLNTDLKGYISTDGGANHTQVTLADYGYLETGSQHPRIFAGTATVSAYAGSDMRWRLRTFNGTNIYIKGVGMTWEK